MVLEDRGSLGRREAWVLVPKVFETVWFCYKALLSAFCAPRFQTGFSEEEIKRERGRGREKKKREKGSEVSKDALPLHVG